jgi:hypothetical protein
VSELLLFGALLKYWEWVERSPDRFGWELLAGCNVIVVALDLWALAAVGMAGSLTAASAGRAAGRAVAIIVVLPSLLYILWMTVEQTFGGFRSATGMAMRALGVWVFLSVLIDLIFGGMAVHTLRTGFRELAGEPFFKEERRSFWPRRRKGSGG